MPLTGEMQQLILNGDNPALVLHAGDDVHLFFLEELTDAEYAAAVELAKSLTFAGIFVMLDGQAQCKCATVESIPVMMGAVGTYARHIAEGIKAKQAPRGDAVAWLENLFKMEDNRDAN